MIDSSDIMSLVAFFKNNPNFHNWELATIAERSLPTIIKWKRRVRQHLGDKANEFLRDNSVPFERHRVPKHKIPSNLSPDVWDHKEWFYDQYVNNKFGILTIARMISRSHIIVMRRLKRFGIESREPNIITNSCCDPEWLHYHYDTKFDYINWCWGKRENPKNGGGKTWSINKCAKIAGVSHTTMLLWLVKHKLKIRDKREAGVVASNHARGRDIIKLYECGDA